MPNPIAREAVPVLQRALGMAERAPAAELRSILGPQALRPITFPPARLLVFRTPVGGEALRGLRMPPPPTARMQLGAALPPRRLGDPFAPLHVPTGRMIGQGTMQGQTALRLAQENARRRAAGLPQFLANPIQETKQVPNFEAIREWSRRQRLNSPFPWERPEYDYPIVLSSVPGMTRYGHGTSKVGTLLSLGFVRALTKKAQAGIKKEYVGQIGDGTKVFVVPGGPVRDNLDVEFGLGAHGLARDYVPQDEIWIERLESQEDMEANLAHELIEYCLMKYLGMNYDTAHIRARASERQYRQKTAQFRGLIRGGAGLLRRALSRAGGYIRNLGRAGRQLLGAFAGRPVGMAERASLVHSPTMIPPPPSPTGLPFAETVVMRHPSPIPTPPNMSMTMSRPWLSPSQAGRGWTMPVPQPVAAGRTLPPTLIEMPRSASTRVEVPRPTQMPRLTAPMPLELEREMRLRAMRTPVPAPAPGEGTNAGGFYQAARGGSAAVGPERWAERGWDPGYRLYGREPLRPSTVQQFEEAVPFVQSQARSLPPQTTWEAQELAKYRGGGRGTSKGRQLKIMQHRKAA